MPRKARILLPHTPHHVVQRGHNRSAVFVQNQDYLYYLDNLAEWSQRLDVKVHSYCLMSNHIHLILEPSDSPETLSLLMKRLAARQCRYVNRLERRSGSLWEGRFKSSPIQRDEYLLQCCRYVEMNPVKAGMVDGPDSYPWSSYNYRVGKETPKWVGEDIVIQILSQKKERAIALYKEFVARGCPDQEFIQQTTDRNQLIGDTRFVAEVEQRIGIRIENRKQGRPRKK